jgi:hypothetical protein
LQKRKRGTSDPPEGGRHPVRPRWEKDGELEQTHTNHNADTRPVADEVGTKDADFHAFAIPAGPTAADQPENTELPRQYGNPTHTVLVHDRVQPTTEQDVEENIRSEAQSLVGVRT